MNRLVYLSGPLALPDVDDSDEFGGIGYGAMELKFAYQAIHGFEDARFKFNEIPLASRMRLYHDFVPLRKFINASNDYQF